jgi:hypothetical protein
VPALGDTHDVALGLGESNTGVVLGVGVAAATLVTVSRRAVKASVPDYAAASERSLTQVLTPLSAVDAVVVACLPGLAEELLFRGALMPAVGADMRGVLVAAAVFGVLHNNGGRNAAFAAFAGAAGAAYGVAALASGSIMSAAVAHAAANLIEAITWKQANAGAHTDSS